MDIKFIKKGAKKSPKVETPMKRKPEKISMIIPEGFTLIEDDVLSEEGFNISELISEGERLNRESKIMISRLEEIKDILKNNAEVGEYITRQGHKIAISETKKWEDIDPFTLYETMKKKKLEKSFWKCVKVALTELKKILPTKMVESLQTTRLPSVKKISFK